MLSSVYPHGLGEEEFKVYNFTELRVIQRSVETRG